MSEPPSKRLPQILAWTIAFSGFFVSLVVAALDRNRADDRLVVVGLMTCVVGGCWFLYESIRNANRAVIYRELHGRRLIIAEGMIALALLLVVAPTVAALAWS